MSLRGTVRGFGELLISAGLVLLLFVAYQLVWTNVEAQREQNSVSNAIRDQWQRPTQSTATAEKPAAGQKTTGEQKPSDFGQGFAFMYIPRLGEKWSVPVLNGVGLDVLARGIGHYPGTALPGQVGNFAVAGHRATHGEPFAYLDRVKPGDVVIVETRKRWLRYVIDGTKIVLPTDVWVIDPVPGKPDVVPTEKLITLTTCNPRWASYERMIVSGHLESGTPKADGRPSELAKGA